MTPLRIGLIVLALGLGGSAAAAEPPPPVTQPVNADHPLVGKIWSPPQHRFVTADEAAVMARSVDALLLGEIHDNPDSHALQAWLVRRLTEAGRRPGLVLEMLDPDQAPRLAEYLDTHPGDAAGIGEAVGWSDSGWPDWALYQPIAAAALEAHGRIVAGNPTRAVTRAIARNTQPPGTLEGLGIADELDDATLADMKAEISDDHCGLMPEAALPGMVRVQRARDASLARAVAQVMAAGEPAVLIAGAGHVRTDRGVPAYLARIAPGRTRLAVALLEVVADRGDPAAYGEDFPGGQLPYDLVWFTAGAEREDPCVKLGEQMKAKTPGK